MKATLQQLLELTQQVFAGTVTRAQLARRTPQEAVFVATAIMFADRQRFLMPNNQVKGIYSRVLERLISEGAVNHLAGEQGYLFGTNLVSTARSMRLYTPVPGRGGPKPIVLDPPGELIALVAQFGITPAIVDFLRDAQQGVEQEATWRQECTARWAAQRLREGYEDHMRRVIEKTVEEYGIDGLRDLRARVEQALREHSAR